jgi:xylan 1,4-beta-xylosidase
VVWQMKDAGLNYSCYYHIRDWYVSFDRFAPFMSEQGTAFMTRWWNRMPQFDGLFDYQNQVRPSYFAFKLLSRLKGERLSLISSHPHVHGFAARDSQLRMSNVLLWNFSPAAVQAEVAWIGLPKDMRTRHIVLDATTASPDENARLHPEPFKTVKTGERLQISLEPWAVHYWSFE